MNIPKQLKSKTVWTGITGLIGTVAAFCTGEIEMATALQNVSTCLIGIFLRTGMMKNG